MILCELFLKVLPLCRFNDVGAVTSLVLKCLISVFIGILVPNEFLFPPDPYFSLDFVQKPWLFMTYFDQLHFLGSIFIQGGKYNPIVAIYFWPLAPHGCHILLDDLSDLF